MKSKQKQTPTEIIDNQRQAVVEKIIEDMNRKVQFGAQCPVCATLSKQPWVMQNIKSWRTYEDMNEPEGEDYLQIIRDISPERIYD